MARDDLRRFGATVSVEGGRLVLETAELVRAIDRFVAASEEFAAAWEALPPGVREHYDGTVLVLAAHPGEEE